MALPLLYNAIDVEFMYHVVSQCNNAKLFSAIFSTKDERNFNNSTMMQNLLNQLVKYYKS